MYLGKDLKIVSVFWEEGGPFCCAIATPFNAVSHSLALDVGV